MYDQNNQGKNEEVNLSAGETVKPNTVCQPVCDSSASLKSEKGPGKNQRKKSGNKEKKQDPVKGGNPNNPLAAYVNHDESPLLKWSGKSIKCR